MPINVSILLIKVSRFYTNLVDYYIADLCYYVTSPAASADSHFNSQQRCSSCSTAASVT